jgi:transcription-repair coupling factor (superfamily II helicase)
MEGGQRLKVMVMLEEYEKRIQFVQDLLNNLLAELKR